MDMYVQEDNVLSRIRTHLGELLDHISQDELERNRNRIIEINHYVDHQKEELENFEEQ